MSSNSENLDSSDLESTINDVCDVVSSNILNELV